MSKKKTYQFDLSIRLMAEAEGVDAAFEAALAKLDPEYVQIRSEVAYQEVTSRSTARIDLEEEIECGIIVKEDITVEDLIMSDVGKSPEEVRERLTRLLDALMGGDIQVSTEPSPEQLLKAAMGEDN